MIWQSLYQVYTSEGDAITVSKGHLHSHVHRVLLHSSQFMATTQVPLNRWMDTEKCVTQGGAKVGLRLWVHKTQFIFVLLLIILLFSIQTVNLLLSHPVYTKWSTTQPQEETPDICDNVDEPWLHYFKWNKSDRARQILCGLTNMRDLKHQTQKQSRRVVTGAEEWGEGDTGPRLQSQLRVGGSPGI